MDPNKLNAIIGIVAGFASIGSFVYVIFKDARGKKDGKPTATGENGNGKKQVGPPPAIKPIAVPGVQEFTSSDKDYMDWLNKNRNGFVINTPREMPSNNMVLHKATCTHITNFDKRPPGAFTEKSFVKVCAADVADLKKWTKRHGRNDSSFSSECGSCRPLAAASPVSPKSGSSPVSPNMTAVVAPKADLQNLSLPPAEYAALLSRCQSLPVAKGNYIIEDYVENLLLTVLDFMMQTPVVEKSQAHYLKNVWQAVRTHQDVKNLLATQPDTEEGNKKIAQYLWCYDHHTRVGLLRRLIAYFEDQGVTTQEQLKVWANKTEYKDFERQVYGMGPAIFNWLVMRQGVETVKSDVHINRFVEETIGHSVSGETAVAALVHVAKDMGVKAYELDWRVWEYQRSQPEPLSA